MPFPVYYFSLSLVLIHSGFFLFVFGLVLVGLHDSFAFFRLYSSVILTLFSLTFDLGSLDGYKLQVAL